MLGAMSNERARFRRIHVTIDRYSAACRSEISGILRYARDRADWEVRILVVRTPEDVREILASRSSWPDGRISCGARAAALIEAEALPASVRRCPVVKIDPPPDGEAGPAEGGHVSIPVDDEAIARTAAELLLRRGHANFGYIGIDGPIAGEREHSDARGGAFRQCLAKEGFSCETFTVKGRDEEWGREIQRLARWLVSLPKPCGLLAYNDSLAKQVLDGCHLARLLVPDQIGLVGVDNETEICENTQPGLTSVLPDFANTGFRAAEILDRLMRGEDVPPTEGCGVRMVVERGSTQDLRGGGRLVSLANEYIARHVGEPLRLADIARHLKVSQSLLELRFREILGHGVKAEILRVRLERVCSLLCETDRAIDEIARECGWENPASLRALFHRRYGMSMREYRMK